MDSTPEKPQLLYSVPSLGIDESKGPPTFVFVTHQLVLDRIPYHFPESAGFFVTNAWLGQPGKHQQRITIACPDGTQLIDTTERPFELQDSEIPYTAITFFQGLQISSCGIHRICIYLDGLLVCRYPLHILLAEESADE